jgi:hypothetical protein
MDIFLVLVCGTFARSMSSPFSYTSNTHKQNISVERIVGASKRLIKYKLTYIVFWLYQKISLVLRIYEVRLKLI